MKHEPSLDQFRWFFEEATDGIFISDHQGRFTLANPSACAMLGYTLEELKQLGIPDVLAPDQAAPRLAELHAGLTVVSERILKRKDGSCFPAELSTKMLPDGSLQAICRNTSMRQRMEEERWKAESRYKQIFETNRAIKLLLDPETGAIIDANPAALQFYGYSREAFLQLKIQDINQLSPGEVMEELEAARREERLYFQFRHRLGSGEIRDVEIYSGPVDLQGKTLLFSIVHDVTARIGIERELRLREEYFRSLIDYAPDVITVVSEDGKIKFQSPAVERVLGYTPTEMVGKDLFGHFHPDDEGPARRAFSMLVEGKGLFTLIEIRCRHQNGTWRTLEIWGNNLLNNPAVEGLVFNSRDITERKKAESELLERTDELERLNRIMVDRELRMVELKAEIARLKKKTT